MPVVFDPKPKLRRHDSRPGSGYPQHRASRLPSLGSCALAFAAFFVSISPSLSAYADQIKPKTKLYLHTDGLEIQVSPQTGPSCVPGLGKRCGVSDARSNTSWLPSVNSDTLDIPAMDYEHFGGSRDVVVPALWAEVAQHFAGINLEVVTKRPPPNERYSMVVIGGRADVIGMPNNIAGLAPLDCNDSNPWDITFVFSGSLTDIEEVGRVVAQEAAHGFGLEHVQEDDFVMNPEPLGGKYSFSRSCVVLDPSPDLSNPDGIKCVHSCENAAYQNAYGELLAMFGPAPIPADREAPVVQIKNPAPGSHYFSSVMDLRLDVSVKNAYDAARATLFINDAPAITSSSYPFSFNISDLRAGQYEAKVEVYDHTGNVGRAETRFSVGELHDLRSNAKARILPTQVKAFEISLSGEPVRCQDNRSCYGGTTCQDGLCLRPVPGGCSIQSDPNGKSWAFVWAAGLLGMSSLRRRRRYGRGKLD